MEKVEQGDNINLMTFSSMKIDKYNTKSWYGEIDNKTTLEYVDDAAYNWPNHKGLWRMPTNSEMSKLINTCDNYLAIDHGVLSYVFEANNGNTIFLPFARGMDENGYLSRKGFYWTSTLGAEPSDACTYRFSDEEIQKYDMVRYQGFSIRPVSISSALVKEEQTIKSKKRAHHVELGPNVELMPNELMKPSMRKRLSGREFMPGNSSVKH